MKATVIVLSWNGADELPACLDAVLAQQGATPDLLVVDNGSTDGALELLRERYAQVRRVENGRNLGFAGGMNVGIRTLMSDPVPPDVIVLLNQDTIVSPDWLANLLRPFEQNPQIGAVGCKIYYPDGRTLQHAGAKILPGRQVTVHFGHGKPDNGQFDQPGEMEYVTGAAMGLRTSALREVGLFDEGYNPAYYEEVDLCWRLRRADYLVHYAPAATLRHAEGTSSHDSSRLFTLVNRNRMRYAIKTLPSERLWDEFVVAERLHARHVDPDSSLARLLMRTYLEGILLRNEWVAARARYHAMTTTEATAIKQICVDLRADLIRAP
jgi:GT2 family glycosyltransferase